MWIEWGSFVAMIAFSQKKSSFRQWSGEFLWSLALPALDTHSLQLLHSRRRRSSLQDHHKAACRLPCSMVVVVVITICDKSECWCFRLPRSLRLNRFLLTEEISDTINAFHSNKIMHERGVLNALISGGKSYNPTIHFECLYLERRPASVCDNNIRKSYFKPTHSGSNSMVSPNWHLSPDGLIYVLLDWGQWNLIIRLVNRWKSILTNQSNEINYLQPAEVLCFMNLFRTMHSDDKILQTIRAAIKNGRYPISP